MDHSRSQTQEFLAGEHEIREPLRKDITEASKGISHGVDSGNRLFERSHNPMVWEGCTIW